MMQDLVVHGVFVVFVLSQYNIAVKANTIEHQPRTRCHIDSGPDEDVVRRSRVGRRDLPIALRE